MLCIIKKPKKQIHYEIVELRWDSLSAALRQCSASPKLLTKHLPKGVVGWTDTCDLTQFNPILHLEEEKFTGSGVPVRDMLEFFIENFGAPFAAGIKEEKEMYNEGHTELSLMKLLS